jgi:hypothetical protein
LARPGFVKHCAADRDLSVSEGAWRLNGEARQGYY